MGGVPRLTIQLDQDDFRALQHRAAGATSAAGSRTVSGTTALVATPD